jgi:hypothetical protein
MNQACQVWPTIHYQSARQLRDNNHGPCRDYGRDQPSLFQVIANHRFQALAPNDPFPIQLAAVAKHLTKASEIIERRKQPMPAYWKGHLPFNKLTAYRLHRAANHRQRRARRFLRAVPFGGLLPRSPYRSLLTVSESAYSKMRRAFDHLSLRSPGQGHRWKSRTGIWCRGPTSAAASPECSRIVIAICCLLLPRADDRTHRSPRQALHKLIRKCG